MSLLYDNRQMMILSSLAKKLENLNEAVFLQQLHYWLQVKKREGKNFICVKPGAAKYPYRDT